MAQAISSATKCRNRARWLAGESNKAWERGDSFRAMQLESESQALYKKADKYESNARKGIYTKAEYERRVKAGKLPPVEADLEDNGPPTEADFWRYGR